MAGTRRERDFGQKNLVIWLEFMKASAGGEVTELLGQLRNGRKEALDKLLPLIYQELRRAAGRQMRHERAGHTLQPTALVHEAFLRLVDQDHAGWQTLLSQRDSIFARADAFIALYALQILSPIKVSSALIRADIARGRIRRAIQDRSDPDWNSGDQPSLTRNPGSVLASRFSEAIDLIRAAASVRVTMPSTRRLLANTSAGRGIWHRSPGRTLLRPRTASPEMTDPPNQDL